MADPEDRPAGRDDRGSGHDDVGSAGDDAGRDAGPGSDVPENGDDVTGQDGEDTSAAEDGDAADAEPAIPPLESAPFIELMAAYRQPVTAGAERLPWSWSTLSPGERDATARVLDGFVESYNRTWAISPEQTLPPCWHRHPALALDLATLAWAYFQAYRDPMATPDLALRFQDHLHRFARRLDRWLGTDPGACRAGEHPTPWHDTHRVTPARPDTTEDADAVVLLGAETFGFVPPSSPGTVAGST